MSNKTKVLFVCLGNICRSPLGEGIFRKIVVDAGLADCFEIDSCGTGAWHVGHLPDPGSIKVAERHGIDLTTQRARQLAAKDLTDFDYILAMDQNNLRNINLLGSVCGKLHLLREFDPLHSKDLNVPDPYGLPGDSFQEVFEIVERCCQVFLTAVKENL